MVDVSNLERGPCPGLLGDVAAMHGRYYAKHWGFPIVFEDKVAREMGAFLQRYDPARDLILWLGDEHRVRGSITIDGSDPALDRGQAHLRWFILDESLAGRGLGRRLVDTALGFARESGFASIYLTTFKGLGSAMALYERAGFTLVDEQEGQTWGRTVLEQLLELEL